MKALLSFFTVLPVRGASLEETAREIHLLPLIGLITGLPGAVLLLSAHFVPPGVAATLALGQLARGLGLDGDDMALDTLVLGGRLAEGRLGLPVTLEEVARGAAAAHPAATATTTAATLTLLVPARRREEGALEVEAERVVDRLPVELPAVSSLDLVLGQATLFAEAS